MKGWFVVQTRPRNEDRASLNLSVAGFEVLNPKMRARKVRGTVARIVLEPLFPSYIFVLFDLESHLRLIRYTRGVRRVVEFGSHPVPLPFETVEAIKARLRNGIFELGEAKLSRGERVRVIDGPFRGLEAVFLEELRGQERVRILLDCLSYYATVVVPRHMVEPIWVRSSSV